MVYAYIFSGLPGVGKTTLAKQLAQTISDAVYLRIDTVECYLKKAYSQELTKQGYELTFHLAKENLELSNNVIIDCCNPVSESRELWNKLADTSSTKVINIEIICNDKQIHKNRVNIRFNKNKKKYPSWQDTLDKDYQTWNNRELVKIDTANVDINDSFKQLMNLLVLK